MLLNLDVTLLIHPRASKMQNSMVTVVKKFELHAQKNPDFIAVQDKSLKLSYKVLNEKANQVARYLKKQHVKSGEVVATLLEPGTDFVISILAIIKIGAVYLPLDTLAPEKRLAETLEDARPKIVITSDAYRERISDPFLVRTVSDIRIESINHAHSNLRSQVFPDSPLYIMYTSGSTGQKKGVIIPHQAVVNLVLVDNYVGVKAGETVSQFSNLAFDACTYEIWSALLNGATLVIIPSYVRVNTDELGVFLRRNAIRYLFLPTAYFHQVIKSTPDTLNHVPVIIFGGEQVNLNLLKNFLEYRKQTSNPCTLVNGYGPTEATTFTCLNAVTEKSNLSDEILMSIGKPIKNVKTYILDEQHQLATEGELYISGINLALSYQNKMLHNQDKFLDNPFCSDTPYQYLYRTGDKVKQLPSGELLFLGRLDGQAKIGGFRIHLSEIERCLMAYPNISLATVKVSMGGKAHKILVAYIVLLDTSEAIHADEIRRFLAESLPAYMLPTKYMIVDALPLTVYGKVDKDKLDSIPCTDLSFHIDVSSTNLLEEKIKSVWCQLLDLASIDSHKNFFDLGANSILITEACSLLNQELQCELQVLDFLLYPTIYRLSRYLEGEMNIKETFKRHAKDTALDIAIVGMACRFPQANSLEEFWNNICQEKDCLEHFGVFDEQAIGSEHAQTIPVRGTLDDIELFDASFFGFNPVDASITDPQHRVFLECAWEALENAGIGPSKVPEKIISVFTGMTDSTYLQENLLKNSWFLKEFDQFQQRIANSMGMLSTQLSYRLNFKGRSINVNTACSTGLIAVEQACQDLSVGNSDIAIAGAISIVVPQRKGYQYQPGSIVSPNGKCRPFSDEANGTVFSNGIGIVVLKRLQEAIKDNDIIYAVIKGRGVNNDGSDKLGYAAPSCSGQMACISEALEQCKLGIEDIRYIETHGSATPLGDAVEFNALTDVFSAHTRRKTFCALGSVKANIGHTDVAAGMAGLIKTALCLYHKTIPSMPNFKLPNPAFHWKDSPFYINQSSIRWTERDPVHHAGVSAFGVGGTNIHMILSEYRPNFIHAQHNEELPQLIMISAKNETALEIATENFIQHSLKNSGDAYDYLTKAAYTLQVGRENFCYRRYAIGTSLPEVLQSFSQNSVHYCDENTTPNIVFMFPGQGLQYPQMVMDLMKIPFFAELVEEGAQLASRYLSCHFLSILLNAQAEELADMQYAQPALFIIEYALAKLLIHYGIRPNALIGQSLGEYVAACIAGVFSYAEGVALICERSMLMAKESKRVMLVLECGAEDLGRHSQSIAFQGVEICLHNSPSHYVVSSDEANIQILEQYLHANQVSYQRLYVDFGLHGRSIEAIRQPLLDMLSHIQFNAPSIPIVSNLTGDWLSAKDACSVMYWYDHLRHTVRLCDGLTLLAQDVNSFFIEIGPGLSLTSFLHTVLGHTSNKNHFTIHCLSNDAQAKGDYEQLNVVLGEAWLRGINIDWTSVYRHQKKQKIVLPSYPFQKQCYWLEPDQKLVHSSDAQLYQPVWSQQVAYTKAGGCSQEILAQHSWIIIEDSCGVSDAIIRELRCRGIQPWTIRFATDYAQSDHYQFTLDPRNTEDYLRLFQTIRHEWVAPIVLHVGSYTDQMATMLSEEETEQQLGRGFYSLLSMIQAYLEEFGDRSALKLAILTSGVHKVLGLENIHPLNATLLGFCRVLRQEHPTMQCKLMDLHPSEHPQNNPFLISRLLEVCVGAISWREQVFVASYRHGYEWYLMYQPITAAGQTVSRLRDHGVYLVTGGLGGIALSCCEAIARTVKQPKFILLSRKALAPETEWAAISEDPEHTDYAKITRIRYLRKLGAEYQHYSVDIMDLKALEAVVQRSLVNWGAIHGIIHTAGVVEPELLQLKSPDSIRRVFAPKIQGTYHLAQVFRAIPLDFIVLKSSLAALLGGMGLVDYCAANACLDAFVASDLFPSAAFVLSINWNTWREVGLAAEAARKGEANFLDMGNDISPKEGQQLFLEALQGNRSQVAVSKTDLNTTEETSTQLENAQLPKISRHALHISTSYTPPNNEDEFKLVHFWQDTLGIDELGVHDNFFALGGHSIQALSLIEKVNQAFRCNLAMTQIYRTPTIHQLEQVIKEELEKTGVRKNKNYTEMEAV